MSETDKLESSDAADPVEPKTVEAEDSTEIRVDSNEVVKRSMKLEARAVEEGSRRVRIAVSSETPVQRSFGIRQHRLRCFSNTAQQKNSTP